jgi:hypothetical protein
MEGAFAPFMLTCRILCIRLAESVTTGNPAASMHPHPASATRVTACARGCKFAGKSSWNIKMYQRRQRGGSFAFSPQGSCELRKKIETNPANGNAMGANPIFVGFSQNPSLIPRHPS